MEMYDPQTIEPKWQKFWDDKKLFKASEDSKKEKYYLLEMLPYPSGRIHMGHVRNYTIGDVAARFKMMQGFCVLHPMGWDAFGLPAENAAIKNKIHPAKWTYENIDVMRSQLKRMGYSYDWDREFATCDPEYYRWEQLIFLKMVEKGLAFKKSSSVNWCDGCQTVLANEQVEQGKCWRCDTVVVQKSMEQWFFKITDYADELLQDIDDKLQGWPERVRVMQKNWIGKSLGVNIFFKVKDSKIVLPTYTTRCDTVFSVTFIAIAPENPIVLDLVQGTKYEKGAKEFIAKVAKQTLIDRENEEKEKEGFFIGKQAINPASGEEIPIYIANFALMYGTGIVMCDAHDKRDFKFAKKYGIPLKFVISKDGKPMDANKAKEAFIEINEESRIAGAEAIDRCIRISPADKARLRLLFLAKHARASGQSDAVDGNHALYHHEMRSTLEAIGLHVRGADSYEALFDRPDVDFVVTLLNRGGFQNSEMLAPLLLSWRAMPHMGASPILRGVSDDKYLSKLIGCLKFFHCLNRKQPDCF